MVNTHKRISTAPQLLSTPYTYPFNGHLGIRVARVSWIDACRFFSRAVIICGVDTTLIKATNVKREPHKAVDSTDGEMPKKDKT